MTIIYLKIYYSTQRIKDKKIIKRSIHKLIDVQNKFVKNNIELIYYPNYFLYLNNFSHNVLTCIVV